jgi:2-polyprenyl-3-methyl-5-hydroxy-6-metoxy-1,4-benzoquinol methylase
VTRVDYDRRLYQTYRAGRSLSPDTGRLWMDALAGHVGRDRSDLTILDLGAGTGRFAVLLADAFESQVVAVEPSEKMRAEAECGSPHARVVYRDGAAGAIPAANGAFDFALLSMVIHHVPDLDAFDTLEQEIGPSLADHYDRLKRRALSSFELMTDADFEHGLARLRIAASLETTPTPILEKIDLLVLRRPHS